MYRGHKNFSMQPHQPYVGKLSISLTRTCNFSRIETKKIEQKGSEAFAKMEKKGREAFAKMETNGREAFAKVENKGREAFAKVEKKGSEVFAKVGKKVPPSQPGLELGSSA